MTDILLLYTSMTGNTEKMAKAIAEPLIINEDIELTQIDMFDDYPENLLDYDGFLIGCYTWGDGDVPDEMLDLLDELEDYDLTGKTVALFGSGDTSYEYFCGALDEFDEILRHKGANIVLSSLKIDMEPEDDDLHTCREFGNHFIEQCPTFQQNK